MNNLGSSVNSNIEWRRSKVQELASQGYNQSEISRMLQISQPTINRDLSYLRMKLTCVYSSFLLNNAGPYITLLNTQTTNQSTITIDQLL